MRHSASLSLSTQAPHRYFKFPGTVPSMIATIYLRAHHLDLEFYDDFYKPGAYLRTHAHHMARWHGQRFMGHRTKCTNSVIIIAMIFCDFYLSSSNGWRRRVQGKKPPLLNLRFDVLVHAKEVLRVVLLLNGREPVVVGTERGFDRVFSLLTQEIQKVRTARERTH
jgi:hypothetical protein